MAELSWSRTLLITGILGACLSSALGALLGAPRTLQALSKDKVIPRFIAKESGKFQSPKTATLITFLVAFLVIYFGELNSIAPILSMFFLSSYGMLNLCAAFEAALAGPSWRPDFKTPWWLSFLGALFCFSVMFMINPGATIIAISFCFLLFYIMHKRKLTAYWGDMRRGMLTLVAKYSIEKLTDLPVSQKSWYPNLLVFFGLSRT